MTRDEVLGLLQVAQSYDSRNIDGLMAQAWQDAANRCGWTVDAAVEAIRRHYATETARIMPGHVTALVRAARPVGNAPQYRRALAPAPPASAETRDRHYRALFGESRRTQSRETGGHIRRSRAFGASPVSPDGPEPQRAFQGDSVRLLGALRKGGAA